nr:hypothetical protein CFP56_52837 [Quercus suber]
MRSGSQQDCSGSLIKKKLVFIESIGTFHLHVLKLRWMVIRARNVLHSTKYSMSLTAMSRIVQRRELYIPTQRCRVGRRASKKSSKREPSLLSDILLRTGIMAHRSNSREHFYQCSCS